MCSDADEVLASTRKEEIERFSKASKDTDFAKMLKARILSPDHIETQSQLRREIRVSEMPVVGLNAALMTATDDSQPS